MVNWLSPYGRGEGGAVRSYKPYFAFGRECPPALLLCALLLRHRCVRESSPIIVQSVPVLLFWGVVVVVEVVGVGVYYGSVDFVVTTHAVDI